MDQSSHIGNVRQEGRENLLCHGKGVRTDTFFPIKGRKRLGKVQPAVTGQSIEHRLGAVNLGCKGAGGMILHNFLL